MDQDTLHLVEQQSHTPSSTQVKSLKNILKAGNDGIQIPTIH